MNLIAAIMGKSEYAECAHLIIIIDDCPLDMIIAGRLKDREFLGLVPSVSWLFGEEREHAWAMFDVALLGRRVVPVLVCPDDCDLACTVVVADMEVTDDAVIWHRLGTDASPHQVPSVVGIEVHWFNKLGPYVFGKAEFAGTIEALNREHQELSRSANDSN